jgi:hypothetical protein
MKQAWDQVTLRVLWWGAEQQPVGGDELQTATGRRYLIQSFDGKKIKAVVLPKNAPLTEGRMFGWEWEIKTYYSIQKK